MAGKAKAAHGGAAAAPRIFVRERKGASKDAVPSHVVRRAKAGGAIQGVGSNLMKTLQVEALVEAQARAEEKKADRLARKMQRLGLPTSAQAADQGWGGGSPLTTPHPRADMPSGGLGASASGGLGTSNRRRAGGQAAVAQFRTSPQVAGRGTTSPSSMPRASHSAATSRGLRTGGLQRARTATSLHPPGGGPSVLPARTSSPGLRASVTTSGLSATAWGDSTGPRRGGVVTGLGSLMSSLPPAEAEPAVPEAQPGSRAGVSRGDKRRLLSAPNKPAIVASSVVPNTSSTLVPRMAAQGRASTGLPRKVNALSTSDSVLKFKYGYSEAQVRVLRRTQAAEKARRRAHLAAQASASAAEVEERKAAFFRAKASTAAAREQAAEMEFKANLRHLQRAHAIAAEFEAEHIEPFERYEADRKKRLLAEWEAKVYQPLQTAVNQHVTRKPLADIVAGRAARLQEYLDVTNSRQVFASIPDPTYDPQLDRAAHTVRVPRVHDPLKQQLVKREREARGRTGPGPAAAVLEEEAAEAAEYHVDDLRDEDTLIALRTRAMAAKASKPSSINKGRVALQFGGVDPQGAPRDLGRTSPGRRESKEGRGAPSPGPGSVDGPEGDLADRIRRAHRDAPRDSRWTLAPELWREGVIGDTHYVKTYSTVGDGLFSADHPAVKSLVAQQGAAAEQHRSRVMPDWYSAGRRDPALDTVLAAEEAVAFGKTYRDAQSTAAANLAKGATGRRTSTAMASAGITQALEASVRPGRPHDGNFASTKASGSGGGNTQASASMTQAMRSHDKPGTPPPAPRPRIRGDAAGRAALMTSKGVAEAVHVGKHPVPTSGLTGFHSPAKPRPNKGGSPGVWGAIPASANLTAPGFTASLPRPRRGKAVSALAAKVSSAVSPAMSQVLHSDARPGTPQRELRWQKKQIGGGASNRASAGATGAMQPQHSTLRGGYDAPAAKVQPGTTVSLSVRARASDSIDRFE